MLQLLQPAWLFSLTGVSVPLIIHLWNPKPGTIRRVGSVALVAENKKEYKKRLQLSDWLLLLLRCLLIALIAFALAKPVWNSPVNARKEKGWVLISKPNARPIYSHFKPSIDSLIKAGFELHWLDEGFAKTLPEEVINRIDSTNEKTISYRALITSLDEQTAAVFPLYLFTDNYMKHFSGRRDTVSLNLHWFTYTPGEKFALKGGPSETDTSTVRITLFAYKYENDLLYLKAAVDAIQQFSKKKIIVTVAKNAEQVPASQDWLFWLSDLPVPVGTTANNVLAYETGKAKKTASWINEAGRDADPVPLYQIISAADSMYDAAENIWQDGFGNAVLSAVRKDSSHFFYHCYTHFDPAWNDLPWSGNFPEKIYQLLERRNKKTSAWPADKRIIDHAQLLPAFIKESGFKKKPDVFKTTDVTGLFWLAVVVLFFTERMLSFQYQKMKAND